MINYNLNNWINKKKKNLKIISNKISLSKCHNWIIKEDIIYHKTKKFFKIIGIKVYNNFSKKNWDQPIIVQNEIGILGLIYNEQKKKYLLQAKVEPGNINKIQLSPTVQATKSNYSRVHKGKQIPYLKYFFNKKNIYKSNQTEQGGRYLNKLNSNILFKSQEKIKVLPNFRWFKKSDIKKLIKTKNMIHMDTMSVLSSFMVKNKKDNPLNNNFFFQKWYNYHLSKYNIKIKICSLKKLSLWNFDKKKITNKNKNFFSVIGLNVKSNTREVKSWSQPIIEPIDMAFSGFLIKKFNNTDHYLCRYSLKPGLKQGGISATINSSSLKNLKSLKKKSFQKKIFEIFNKKNKEFKTIHKSIQSDEGGRFFHSQCLYEGCLLSENFEIQIPKDYIWLSYNQVINLIKMRKLDIEARLLFSYINF